MKKEINLLRLVRIAWLRACARDGIEPESKFVVFSDSNPYALLHSRLMGHYFKTFKMVR